MWALAAVSLMSYVIDKMGPSTRRAKELDQLDLDL